jgi:hypothetical protein
LVEPTEDFKVSMRSSVTAVKAGGTSDVKILDNDGNCASSWFSEMHDTHAVYVH